MITPAHLARYALTGSLLGCLAAAPPLLPPTPPLEQPRQSTDDPAAHILKFDPIDLNFGQLHRGDKVVGTVTLTNTSDSPISINRAFATCGCTVPVVPEEPIGPGESVEVEIEYRAQNPGAISSTVQFFLDDSLGAAAMTVSAEVLQPIEVTPGVFEPLFESDLTLTLTSTDGTEFQIYGVEPDVVTGADKVSRVTHEVTIDAAKAKAIDRPFNSIRFYVDHGRTSVVFLRSSKIQMTAQTQQMVQWARGSGAIEDLEQILNDGGEIDRPDSNGRTPLMFAAQGGQIERALILLEQGADVNAQRPDGETPLMSGAKAPDGSVETLRVLIDAGADVIARYQYGRTALFWAARSGSVDRLQFLLDAGSDINVRGPYEETELIAAVKSRNIAKVRALVEAGAEVAALDSGGRDALEHARAALAYSRGPAAEPVREIIRYLEQRGAASGG